MHRKVDIDNSRDQYRSGQYHVGSIFHLCNDVPPSFCPECYFHFAVTDMMSSQFVSSETILAKTDTETSPLEQSSISLDN